MRIRNLETTLAGIVGAAAISALAVIEANGGVPNWPAIGTAAAIATIGYLAKDGRKD